MDMYAGCEARVCLICQWSHLQRLYYPALRLRRGRIWLVKAAGGAAPDCSNSINPGY